MTLWFALLLRVTCLAALGLLALRMARRQSATTRHVVALSTLAAIAAVAPLNLLLPAWNASPRFSGAMAGVAAPVEAPAVIADAAATLADDPVAPPGGAVPWAAAVWAAGTFVSLVSLASGLLRLRHLRRGADVAGAEHQALVHAVARDAGMTGQVDLRISPRNIPPVTWGALRPTVLLPCDVSTWQEQRLQTVLAHELAHIRRHDWVSLMFGEGLKAALWFHPLVWLLCRRLRRESELACDDAVLESGVRPTDYASHLLAIARACRQPVAAALPMARLSTLERRITAMLTTGTVRTRPSWAAIAFTCLAWSAVTLPVAAVGVQVTGPLPLTGAVYDVSGAVMPDVKLTLKSAEGLQVEATSDAAGRYEFPAVGPGKYELEATLAGFRPLRYELELRRDRDWMQVITLQVGTVRETITVQSSRLPGAEAAPAASGPKPVRVGGNLRAPRKLKHVSPVYPESMRAAGIEGVVPLEAIISAQGTVQSVRVLSATVHPDLAMAAIDAVRQWRFEATLLNGQPVDVMLTTTVQFRLAD